MGVDCRRTTFKTSKLGLSGGLDILEGYLTERWEKIPKNVYNCGPIPYKQCMESKSKNDLKTV